MSTEIRFTSVPPSVDAHRFGGDVPTERDHRVGRARRPLRLERVDVDLHVVGRRMARGQVLRLDLGAAARAVELEDPAPGRVRGEGELVAVRVDERTVDLARVTVVDQRAFLIVPAGRPEVLRAPAAPPPLALQVDLEVLGHGDAHRGGQRRLLSVSRRSPAAVVSKCQPSGTRMVKNGPSITAGPDARAPGRWVSSWYTGVSACPPRPSRSTRIPSACAGDAAMPPPSPSVTCGSGASSTSSKDARSPGLAWVATSCRSSSSMTRSSSPPRSTVSLKRAVHALGSTPSANMSLAPRASRWSAVCLIVA